MSIHIAGQYFLNHHLEEQELRKQVRALISAGYESIYGEARTGMQTPYFSEAWWKAIEVIVEECRNAGVKFSIWDEDNYPSAVAGDRIVWNHPELAAQLLEFTVAEASGGGQAVELTLKKAALLNCYAFPKTENGFGEPIEITASCGTVKTSWGSPRVNEGAYSESCKVGLPHRRRSMYNKTFALLWQPEDKREYVVVATQVVYPESLHNTDLLNPESTRKFIEYTHREYLERFGEESLKNDFHATFMDEPAPAGVFPWTRNFDCEFTEEHGFSLLSLLPHLVLDIDSRTPLIRHKYRMTQMRLQCEGYLSPIQDWCRDHGIKSIGHLTRTEMLTYVGLVWPNELRCHKYLDIPCTDPLGAGIAWRDACAYHTGLKVASSAAHIYGKQQAGSDALAVSGNETSLRDLKFSLDYQMVMGINYFNIHGLNYSLDGPRKDETPPSLFYQHSEWKYMNVLLKHTKQTCEALSGGNHLCGIAVLYPSASFYCHFNSSRDPMSSALEGKIHHFSETLLSNQKDFDFIDEITLAELTDSGMPEDWQVIVLPYLEYIENRSAQCLLKFIASGGKVIVIGEPPHLLGESLEDPLAKWSPDGIIVSEDMTRELISELPGPELIGEGCSDIFVLQRKKDGEIISFLFNRAERPFSGSLEGRPLSIAPKGSLLLRDSDASFAQTDAASEPMILSNDWKLEFEPNHIPLCHWKVTDEEGSLELCNMLERQTDSLANLNGRRTYSSRFLFTGSRMPLKLVLEESSIRGKAKIFVNKIEIKDFRSEQVYDCRNVTAEIGDALRGNTTPSENIVTIETEEGGELLEMPYLYGDFECEHRYAYKSRPFLSQSQPDQALSALQPWNVLGYEAFSGTGRYSKEIEVSRADTYRLSLGRVEDVAEVFIDGKPVEVLAWPPYECTLDLEAGRHELRIDITNGPGNRDRLAGLAAGLLGPVALA